MVHSETQFQAKAPAGPGAQAAPPDELFPGSESEFLIQLGDRVRDTRRLRKMSRRELARRSGISERYIARIEAGIGKNAGAMIAAAFVILMLEAALIAFWP